MRFLSLCLPRLATDRIARGRDPSDQPFATVGKVKGAYRLVALDARAQKLGLKPGTALADARAMIPALAVHEADPAGDADTLLGLVDWCRLFTPLAAPDAPDGAMLDISGAAHLFGGEHALLDMITRRLAKQGFFARAAIAGSSGAAWALARHGGTRRLIPEAATEGERAKLFGPMPLAALRLEPRAIDQFGQAGLRRIGDLLLRPRAPIAARFGPTIYQRLDELLERARAPISPRFEAPSFMAERRFAEGITRREAIEAAILALSTDLCGLLARHGEGARKLDVSLFRVDGVVRHIEAGTSRPLRDPQTMARLFRERLDSIGEEGLDSGYGFDVIRLAALAAERLDDRQSDWDETGAREADLADLVDRLGARFGLARVTRLMPIETHVPERAVKPVPAVATRASLTRIEAMTPIQPRLARARRAAVRLSEVDCDCASPRASWALAFGSNTGQPCDEGGQDGERHGANDQPVGFTDLSDPLLPERPIRLLQRPEPIDTIAGVPDGPPSRFRWRRVLHQVAAIEGPERIGPEWWKGAAPTRDYFRAEDTQGQRFWLFREGLYQDTPEPRWFMHGLFA